MLAALALTLAAGAANAALPPAQIQAIDAAVRKTMQSAKTPGVSIAIVRGDRIVYAQGYGLRDLASHAPVDTNTVFRWGSVSKQFAAGSILILESQGKLSVDDPLSRWYPALTDASGITLRDILNQVSGYRDYYPLDYVDLEMSHPTTMDAILREYGQAPLTAPARTRWEYSNTNYTIVGSIVQRVSGMSIADFYRREIFSKLEMTRTDYDEPMQSESDRAAGYNSYWTEPQHTDAPEADGWLNSAGALAGTASDLARWDIAMMNRTLFGAQQFAQMAQDRKLNGGRTDTHYGFGVGVEHRSGHLLLEHGGNVIGFASDNVVLPDDRTAIVVLTNSYEAPAGEIAEKIAEVLIPALAPNSKASAGPKPRAGPKPTASDIADVSRIRTGLGELADGTMPRSAMTADFAYLLNAQNRVRAEQALHALGPIRTVRWVFTTTRGGLNVTGAAVQFARGSVTAVLYETPSHRIAELMLFP